jgi:hypothetical protein
MPSSGMLRRVILARTDVSKDPNVSIIRVTRISELGTRTDSCRFDDEGATFLRNVGSYKNHTA